MLVDRGERDARTYSSLMIFPKIEHTRLATFRSCGFFSLISHSANMSSFFMSTMVTTSSRAPKILKMRPKTGKTTPRFVTYLLVKKSNKQKTIETKNKKEEEEEREKRLDTASRWKRRFQLR